MNESVHYIFRYRMVGPLYPYPKYGEKMIQVESTEGALKYVRDFLARPWVPGGKPEVLRLTRVETVRTYTEIPVEKI